MPIEIRMPALSPTMTEGNLTRWLKKEGDEVHSGDVIAEIETDKATMEYEAVDEGRLGKIIVPEGAQGIKANAPIAVMLEEGEDPAALDKFTAAAPPAGVAPKTEPAPAVSAPAPAAAMPATPAAPRSNGEGRIFASPLARRMAHHAGVDLATIRGSGPQGRIVKADIERTLATSGVTRPAAARAPAITPSPAAPLPADAPFESL